MRRQRFDRLAEALLVGQERAALLQQVLDPGALEWLQLAAQGGRDQIIQRGVGRAGQRHQPGGVRVLLPDLLQAIERLGRHPRPVLGDEPVEVRHPEWIGNRSPAAGRARDRLARAPATGHAVQSPERLQHPGVVPGREHERRLLVDLGQLEHRRRRRSPRLERRHAPCCGMADPALQRFRVDRPPGLERERQARAASARCRSLAQRAREALVVAEQQEHRSRAGAVDLDRSAPGRGALDPTLDLRIDRARRRAAPSSYAIGTPSAWVAATATEPAGPSSSSSAAYPGQCASERRVLRGDQDPLAAAAIAPQLDVVRRRRHRGLDARTGGAHDLRHA